MASETSSSSQDPTGAHHNWQTSTMLIVITVMVALACITVLSATLTQTRVATLVVDGVSIRKLDHIGRNWATIPRRLETQTRNLTRAQGELAKLSGEAATATATRTVIRSNMERLLANFYHRIKTIDATLAERIHNKGYADQTGFIQAAKESFTAAHPEFKTPIKEIEDNFAKMIVADSENTIADARKTGAQKQVDLLKEGLAATKLTLEETFAAIKPDLKPEDRARIENAFYELNINNFDSGLFNRFTYRILTLPSDLLTLFLVILMGILGSALQITHAYFMKNQVQTIGGYFQRISVGAMTALVIFIVAKAGVPVIADPSRLGGEAPINPYFVSFLAIVSGLLSENAIANVQEQGRKLFGSNGGEPNRWTRHDLTEDLKAQNITIGTLAEYLAVDEKSAEAMLKGEKEIGPQQQKTLAICLRTDPRELFTDMPPHAK